MLRKGSSYDEGGYRYCVLGACERAAYDLGLAVESTNAFTNGSDAIGYILSEELGLGKFSRAKFGMHPPQVNDALGYDKALRLLDEFICETESVVKPRGKRTL